MFFFKPTWKSKPERLGWACGRCNGEEAESSLSGGRQGGDGHSPTALPGAATGKPPRGQGAGGTGAVALLTAQTSHLLRSVGTLGVGGSLILEFCSFPSWTRAVQPELSKVPNPPSR